MKKLLFQFFSFHTLLVANRFGFGAVLKSCINDITFIVMRRMTHFSALRLTIGMRGSSCYVGKQTVEEQYFFIFFRRRLGELAFTMRDNLCAQTRSVVPIRNVCVLV